FLACPDQHFRRRIDTGDQGTGPALRQQAGDVARPAAEIVDGARTFEWNLREQVERRAQAIISEFQVLTGIPGRHFVHTLPLWNSDRGSAPRAHFSDPKRRVPQEEV